MELSPLLNKMLVFIVLMVIAWWLARRGVLTPDFTRIASRLVLNVFMTGTILNAMVSTGSTHSLQSIGEVLLLTTVVVLVGYAVGFVFSRFVHITDDQAPVYELLLSVGNSVFIAMPIAQSLYGDYAVFIVSVSCIPFNVLLYSYGVWRMKKGGSRGVRIKDIFSVPLIVTLIGIVIILLRIPVPAAFCEVFSTLGGATVPMSMMVIGASLGTVSLTDAFRNPRLALVSAVRLLLVPAVTWAVCRLLTDDAALLMTCLIVAASPCAVIVTVLSLQYGRDAVFSSEGVQHSTICSMITIPLIIRLFSTLV